MEGIHVSSYCILCGNQILGGCIGNGRWKGTFRLAYKWGDKGEISGVGYREKWRDILYVPRAENSRWDDEPKPENIKVCLECHPWNSSSTPAILLHEACWSLLKRVHGQRTVPLARLVCVCDSLRYHLSRNVISWGHSYGGMVEISGISELHYSVTGREETWRPIEQDPFPDGNQPWRSALRGPMRRGKSDNRRESKPYPVKRIKSRSESICCLDRLPWDVWFEIFPYLTVHDCLQLRFMSSGLSNIMQSPQFWTSKIMSEECDFAFEVRELEPDKFVNSRWLYRFICTKRAASLRNRARIWELARYLKGILELSDPDPTTVVDHTSEDDTRTITNKTGERVSLIWVDLILPIRPTIYNHPHRYIGGCYILYTQRVILTSQLRRITVSCMEMEGTEYITGLELSFDDGTSTQLGYRSRDNSSASIAAFGGFVVAAGTSRVHGLQIIDKGSHVTRWFGSNKRCPQSRRLKLEGEIVGISASFDGFKLVSLALGRPEMALGCPKTKKKSKPSRLNTAFWYPGLPPDNLRMEDGLSVGQPPIESPHNLLFWVWFGGPGGSYLQHLTGISITRSKGKFCGIEFHFSNGSIPITSRKLGRCDDKQKPDFAIDGAGGERITSVHGKSVQTAYQGPALVICTNRRRKFAALRQNNLDVAKMKKLFPGEPNSILTGFYTTYRDHDAPLHSLGCLWERSS